MILKANAMTCREMSDFVESVTRNLIYRIFNGTKTVVGNYTMSRRGTVTHT